MYLNNEGFGLRERKWLAKRRADAVVFVGDLGNQAQEYSLPHTRKRAPATKQYCYQVDRGCLDIVSAAARRSEHYIVHKKLITHCRHKSVGAVDAIHIPSAVVLGNIRVEPILRRFRLDPSLSALARVTCILIIHTSWWQAAQDANLPGFPVGGEFL